MAYGACSRRAFLAASAAAAAAQSKKQLPKNVEFLPGAVNGLILREANRSALFYGDPSGRLRKPDALFLTHHRRDVLWAADEFLAAPAGIDPFWPAMFREKRLHDYENQVSRVPLRTLPPLQPPASFPGVESIATPGYSREALSYVFQSGGQRIAVTGDLIYAGGRLLDIYSLQDAIPELKVRGYHGYASRAAELLRSLEKIQALQADILVPARGPILSDPARDLSLLRERIQTLYENYLSTDAYRWYFGPENFQARAKRVLGAKRAEGMPLAETRTEFPAWLRAVNNSRLIVSANGEAILVDCGGKRNWEQVRAWRNEGVFRKLSAIYITHYHDDHTDFAQAAAEEFGAEVWSSSNQAEILREPAHFRMPCLTPNPISSLKPWKDGESRRWNEFQLTSFDFPGQTLYHGALLVEPARVEDRILFVGDSFTPSGMDDYCLLNRNFVGEGQGLDYCLGVVERLSFPWLINQHVNPLFRFTSEQAAYMRSQLTRRRNLLSELCPLPGPNFAVDEQWLRLSPYVQKAKPGEVFTLEGVIWNHSSVAQSFAIQLGAPKGWRVQGNAKQLRVGAGKEAKLQFQVQAPSQATGVAVITASVRFGDWDLRHWAEAIVAI